MSAVERVIGAERIHLESCVSTNDEVIRRAEVGAREGLVVTADGQTGGRGRRGRSWLSPAGKGVYGSVLLRPDRALSVATQISLLSALAAAEATEAACGVSTRVKWPNDLMAHDRKLGGVLTEVIRGPTGPPALVVGIGLNVNYAADDFSEETRAEATSLRLETGECHDCEGLTNCLLETLDARYRQFLEQGAGEIIADFRRRDITLRRVVRVTLEMETIEGVAEHIDESGALGVRTTDGSLRLFMAGAVTVRL